MDFSPDVLAGFSAAPLGRATLVRSDTPPANPRAAVLHVHGYNDYFYQAELAHWFEDQGLAFYAVDMRGAGRSERAGDHPHDMASLTEPGDDIAAACEAIAEAHPALPIILHAHSTGGLSAAIWVADRPHPHVAGLVLNSPLFGLPMTRGQALLARVVTPIKKLRPTMIVSRVPSLYNERIHVNGGGNETFDQDWKRPQGIPTTAQWAGTVRGGWKRIDGGLGIALPVLVARSASTGPERDDNPRFNSQDVVVDTAETARLTPKLGPLAEELVVEDGMHDLTLSAPGPRAAYFRGVADWLDRVLEGEVLP